MKLITFLFSLVCVVAASFFTNPTQCSKQLKALQERNARLQDDSIKARLWEAANANKLKFQHHCDSLVKAKADAMEKLNSRSNNTINN